MKTRKEVNGRKLIGLAVALLLCLSLLAPAAEAALFSEKGNWGSRNFTHRVFDNDQLQMPASKHMPPSLSYQPVLTCPWSPNGLAQKGLFNFAGGAAWHWNGFGPQRWLPAFTALPVLPISEWMQNMDLPAYLEDHIPVMLFGFHRPFIFGLAFVPTSIFNITEPPAPVPIPGAVWLMASGLGGIALIMKKRRRTAAGS